jgi:Flagellar biosynthesis/type III secretory pathway protein
MDLSKILKRSSIVVDNAKKFVIPVSGMPPEESEQELGEISDFVFPVLDMPDFDAPREREQESQTILEENSLPELGLVRENREKNIKSKPKPRRKPKEPEIWHQEYNFEDFNFSEPEPDSISAQQEIEKRREESELAAAQLFNDARTASEKITKRATQTAELIVTHTLDSAKAELGNAITAGYTDGFETGRNEALKILEPALNKIDVLTETIKRLQDKMLYEFRDGMFSLISEISQKIVHKEVSENNLYLSVLFSDAIQNIKAEEFVTITVAESELTLATRNEKLFLAEIPHIKDFKILPDKNAAKGTMIVETEKTVVDASIDVQLEKVEYLLQQMKENLDIPKTLDDLIDQTYIRSIDNQAGMMADENYEDYENYETAYDNDIDGTGIDNMNNIESQDFGFEEDIGFQNAANTENSDDISDEEIMKYFEDSDFNDE